MIVGLVLLVLLTDALTVQPAPTGADWWEYRLCGYVLQHPEYTHYYPPWRPALYPTLLGLLGEAWGYGVAATVISSGSLMVMLVGSALTARLLAGPWAGAAAAIAFALLPLNVVGAHWHNVYPFLGALCAASVAASLVVFRWPRWPLALTAGLLAGLGWAGDSRGILLVPVALIFAAMGPRGGWQASGRSRLLLVAVVLVGLGSGKAFERALAVKGTISSLDHAAAAVDPGVGVPPMNAADETHPPGPGPEGPDAPPSESGGSLEAVLEAGSPTKAIEGIWGHQVQVRSLPVPALIWLPLLALLPAKRGWRAVLASLGVLVYVLGQVVVPAWLTDFGARYAYFYVGCSVVLVTVAPYRLVETVGRRAPGWVRVVVASVLALALAVGLWARRPDHDFFVFAEDKTALELSVWFEGRIQPGDQWLECGILGAETLWYPKLHHDGDLNPYGADWNMCRAYVRTPTAPGSKRWLVSVDRLTDATPEVPGVPFSSSIPDPATLGWMEQHRFQPTPESPWVIIWLQAP